MMSVRERYVTDPAFHSLVDTMVQHIVNAQYTPSEMREAALFASILYESSHVRKIPFPKEVINWLSGKEAVITTRDGLLYCNGRMLEAPEANNVARARGFGYAENLIQYLEKGGF